MTLNTLQIIYFSDFFIIQQETNSNNFLFQDTRILFNRNNKTLFLVVQKCIEVQWSLLINIYQLVVRRNISLQELTVTSLEIIFCFSPKEKDIIRLSSRSHLKVATRYELIAGVYLLCRSHGCIACGQTLPSFLSTLYSKTVQRWLILMNKSSHDIRRCNIIYIYTYTRM